MLYEVIALILVILVVNLFLIYVIKNLSKKFKSQMQDIIIKNLGSYDDLIEEKERKLNDLNNELSKVEDEISRSQVVAKEIASNQKMIASSYFGHKVTEYENDSFFTNYQYIKDSFNMDYAGKVEEFIKNNQATDVELYELYKSISKKLDIDTYYNIMKVEESKQEECLRALLSKEEEKVINEYYLKYDELVIGEFYEFINDQLMKLDTNIVIKGNNDFRYLEELDPRITFENDSSIIEGIKIIYRGKVVDYSL